MSSAARVTSHGGVLPPTDVVSRYASCSPSCRRDLGRDRRARGREQRRQHRDALHPARDSTGGVEREPRGAHRELGCRDDRVALDDLTGRDDDWRAGGIDHSAHATGRRRWRQVGRVPPMADGDLAARVDEALADLLGLETGDRLAEAAEPHDQRDLATVVEHRRAHGVEEVGCVGVELRGPVRGVGRERGGVTLDRVADLAVRGVGRRALEHAGVDLREQPAELRLRRDDDVDREPALTCDVEDVPVPAFDLGIVATAGDPARNGLVVLPRHVREPERRLERHGVADAHAPLGVGRDRARGRRPGPAPRRARPRARSAAAPVAARPARGGTRRWPRSRRRRSGRPSRGRARAGRSCGWGAGRSTRRAAGWRASGASSPGSGPRPRAISDRVMPSGRLARRSTTATTRSVWGEGRAMRGTYHSSSHNAKVDETHCEGLRSWSPTTTRRPSARVRSCTPHVQPGRQARHRLVRHAHRPAPARRPPPVLPEGVPRRLRRVRRVRRRRERQPRGRRGHGHDRPLRRVPRGSKT